MIELSDIAIARSAVLFSSLPQELASAILRQSVCRNYARSETIFVQGDLAENIYVVLEGWVKLFRITPTGAEAVRQVQCLEQDLLFRRHQPLIGEKGRVNELTTRGHRRAWFAKRS